MTRRRWLVAGAVLAAAGAAVLAVLIISMAALYSVTIDLLEIVSIPHG